MSDMTFGDPICFLCGSSKVKFLSEWRGGLLAGCGDCGLIFRDPPPSAEDNERFYREHYYDSLGDRLSQIEKSREPLYRSVLEECAESQPGRRLLDVGSGFGGFLRMAAQSGWDVRGIEPSEDAWRVSRTEFGVRVSNVTVENADFPDQSFDLITLWNVLDYLLDPAGTLRKIHRWLSPEGTLVLRIPNAAFHLRIFRFYAAFGRFFARFGWNKNPGVFQRANFRARTVSRLLSKTGFEEVKVKNAPLTRGDAYGVFSHAGFMGATKAVWSFFSGGIFFLSGGRFLIGPSLIIFARRRRDRAYRARRARIALKKTALHILAVLGYLAGLPLWVRLFRPERIVILLYHSVNSSGYSDLNVRPDMFEKQMAFLKRHYSIVSLERAVAALRDGRLPDRPSVVLTFDDGYRDNYEKAFPLLKQRDLSAAFFLLAGEEEGQRKTSHLGGSSCCADPLVSWEQAAEMSGAGMVIGSHGNFHARLKELSEDRLRCEMVSSKKKLEQETKKTVRFFSYPYGTAEDFGAREEAEAERAGYEAALSKIYGFNGRGSDLRALRRIGIEASDTLFTLRAKLNGALGFLSLFDFRPVRKMVRRINRLFVHKPSGSRKDHAMLLVSVDFPPHTDGVSTISRELAIRLSEAGKTMFVIGPKDRGDRGFDAAYSYRILRVPGYDWGYLRFIPIMFAMPWVVLRRGVKKIFAMNIAYGGFLAWALSFLRPLDYVLFAYGYEFEKVKGHPVSQWLYRRIYGRAKKIVCCSRAVKDRLAEFGALPEKIEVLYPGVDLKKYFPLPVPPDYLAAKNLAGRRILLTTGRLVERKGHDQVIRALPKLAAIFPDILYVIVGIGPAEIELRKLAKCLKMEGNIRFMGRLAERELLFLYNACEVFVMPSREIRKGGHIEGFGIVFLEANACGKPVVGGKSGGVAEAICDGRTGFLVDPDSPEEIAEKIEFLFTHPAQSRRMGEEGLRWVRENFDWASYVKISYELLYGKDSK
jgi:phosphatidylinositol alpha-1,6-mannosyltransferase